MRRNRGAIEFHLGIAVAIIFATFNCARAAPPNAVVQQILSATRLFVCVPPHGKILAASGFFISDRLYLTAAHVIDAAKKIPCDARIVEFPNSAGVTPYHSIDKTACHFDSLIDAGFCVVPRFNHGTISISSQTPKIGTKVSLIGFPHDNAMPFLAEGTVLGMEMEEVMTNIRSAKGDSGSPVFDDSGKVIGLMERIDKRKFGSGPAKNVAFLESGMAVLGYLADKKNHKQ